MSKVGELKLFCDKFNLEFPDIVFFSGKFTVTWCAKVILTGMIPNSIINSKNAIIIYILNELSRWLDSEVNFLELIYLDKKYMR
jgi:hypothetical protein